MKQQALPDAIVGPCGQLFPVPKRWFPCLVFQGVAANGIPTLVRRPLPGVAYSDQARAMQMAVFALGQNPDALAATIQEAWE